MAGLLAHDTTLSTAAFLAYQAASENATGSLSSATGGISSDAQYYNVTTTLTQNLAQLGLIAGSAATPAVTLYTEPAFFPQASTADPSSPQTDVGAYPDPSPLYLVEADCNGLSSIDAQVLASTGQALSSATGVPTECASLTPSWRNTSADISRQLYCGWRESQCIWQDGQQVSDSSTNPKTDDKGVSQYTSAIYDWQTTDRTGLHLSIWANDSNAAQTPQDPPALERWNQPMNLATNAYLRYLAGPGYGARLTGVRDMPKASSNLVLDFSSLLGPLFAMWLMQLLLPVNVYALVHEKEAGLRLMMKMQGLSDRALHVVTYLWQLALYIAFMLVFVIFGALIGLKIFTHNGYGVQAVFYLLWGNLLSAWSLWYAALHAKARTAVMLCVVWVILSGFMANLVLLQFVEHGPGIAATLLQLIPSFALYRGLYELSQYAFLAASNGGDGLTWSKLRDPDNGMLAVWVILAVEWALFLFQAWYIDQVTDMGTGVRRHPLFFLGMQLDHDVKRDKKQRYGKARVPLPTGIPPSDAAAKAEAEAAQDRLEAGLLPKPLHRVSSSAQQADQLPVQTAQDVTDYFGESMGAYSQPADILASEDGEAESSWHGRMAGARVDLDPFPEIRPADDDNKPLPKAKSPAALQPEHSLPSEVGDRASMPKDVAAEAMRVEALWQATGGKGGTPETAVLLHKLRKVYPGRNGNPPKVAVKGLSLAIARCECFGLLGPNGAGKTTLLRTLEGFVAPTSGSAVIEGHDVRHSMDAIYACMGTCPQGDLLWGLLTGREHLLFYARLHNFKGAALEEVVAEGLRSVNLLADGAGDRQVASYSGGMKRRLSVAAALVGNPSVVYLDEPSTGLDPISRQLLWRVVRCAARDKAVLLTTHSMEEAEAICGRLGILVAGELQCIGHPKELTRRYGSYLSFSITTPPSQDFQTAALVQSLAPSARKVYGLNGTHKYELPVEDTAVEDVFVKVQEATASRLVDVIDWGISDGTLEEVFIKITREAAATVVT